MTHAKATPEGRGYEATGPEKFVRPEILAIQAYHVGDAVGMVKLDAMENPFPLPDALRRELGDVLSRVDLNRYPDPTGTALRAKLREVMQVPEGMDILLGNGSDDLIQIMTVALARPGATLMYPSPNFIMYSMDAVFSGMKAVGVPVREDFSLDLPHFLDAIREHRPALVFIAYPNNPTGALYAEEDIVEVIRACEGLVVLDEAYHVFARRSFMSRLPEFQNLAVLRTVSKLGLAGMRLGYMAAHPGWIAQFNKVRQAYNVNSLTQAAALFLLDRLDVLEAQAESLRIERGRLAREIALLPGITVYPSEANFLLVRVPDADRVFEALKERRVLVRSVNAGLTRNCIRITIGSPDENRILMDALSAALGSI